MSWQTFWPTVEEWIGMGYGVGLTLLCQWAWRSWQRPVVKQEAKE